MLFNIIFFIFPFLIYAGIALQGISFYVLGIALPCLLFFLSKKSLPNYFIKVGVCFVLLHIIFPITNFINYFFPNKTISSSIYTIQLKWPGILQSNFPSSLFFGGLSLILFGFISQKISECRADSSARNIPSSILRPFLMGLALASTVFFSALLYQHYSGIDLRSLFRSQFDFLGRNDMFDTGGFRVYGFYGHPLTAGGVCLTYSIFSWALLWSWLGKRRPSTWSFIPFYNQRWLPIVTLSTIAITNGMGVILSGGRTATLVGIALIIFIPIFFDLKNLFFKTMLVVIMVTVGSFFVTKQYGVFNRIHETSSAIIKNDSLDPGNYRPYFWKTYFYMFLDQPIFGQGNYWLKQGVRDEYYNRLGYKNLPEKFPAHNMYLEILGSVGLFGMAWIVGVVYLLYRTLRREILTADKNLSALNFIFLLCFVANLLHGFTQNVFFDSSVVYIYICFVLLFMWESAVNTNSKKG